MFKINRLPLTITGTNAIEPNKIALFKKVILHFYVNPFHYCAKNKALQLVKNLKAEIVRQNYFKFA
jgi:hypothetical protein